MLLSLVKRRGGGPTGCVAKAHGPTTGIKFTAKDQTGSPTKYVNPLTQDALVFRRETTASIFI